MLGIILGVSSLIAMSALVKGMENGMKEALIAIGGLEKIRIEPQDVPPEQRHLRDQSPGITINDVYALEASAPLVEKLSPEMRLMRGTISAKGESFRPFMTVGVWPIAAELNEHVIEHGRMFNELDDEMARNVCVIGTATRDELFGAPEDVGHEIIPLGETVYINNQPFTIIGMFKHYESEQDRKRKEIEALVPKQQKTGPERSRGGNRRNGSNFVFWLKNATVYVPLNTMWIKLRSAGASGGRGEAASTVADPRLTTLEVKISDFDHLAPAIQQIYNVLFSTHKGIEDFTFRTQEEWAENIRVFIQNARLSGGMIAGISLLVGGIGIMNIMLASISERVREIGIRKSVGATTFDIFSQILIESTVISVIGGLAGLATSYILVQTISALAPTDNTPVITATAMLMAFGFSVLIGILAGLVPAVKASRLHPIQALRYD
ncbi:MAG: ABC transporter permease [Verrucomicrobiota bacterium]|nr:ABC transporter permease [Verrucomicrobiota bacterium]